jgi:tetratricopeptide (TPR) repeat protein
LGGTTVLAARVIAAYERGYDEQIRTGSLIEALSYARKLSQLGAPGAKESLARARQLQALRLRIDALIQTALTTSGVARNRLMRSASELHLSQPMSAGSRALVALSGHYIDEGRTNEALAACDRAELILDPSDKKVLIDLHAHRGAAQLASGNIKESLESLQAAHSMAPQHKTAARDLARAYLALSKVRKAMLIIEQRTEANPESTEWLNLLGQAQVQMGRIDEGVATLYASLAVDGTQAQVHLALGEILAERGEKLAAREHLTQVVKLGAARGLTLMKARAEGILRRL